MEEISSLEWTFHESYTWGMKSQDLSYPRTKSYITYFLPERDCKKTWKIAQWLKKNRGRTIHFFCHNLKFRNRHGCNTTSLSEQQSYKYPEKLITDELRTVKDLSHTGWFLLNRSRQGLDYLSRESKTVCEPSWKIRTFGQFLPAVDFCKWSIAM